MFAELATWAPYGAVLAGGLLLGLAIGLRQSAARRRAHELAAELESANKERELALAELDASRDTLARIEKEHADYRTLVADHFAGASDHLRELTFHHRAVYQHLAEGASALCPERFVGLEGGAFEVLNTGAGKPPGFDAEEEAPDPSDS